MNIGSFGDQPSSYPRGWENRGIVNSGSGPVSVGNLVSGDGASVAFTGDQTIQQSVALATFHQDLEKLATNLPERHSEAALALRWLSTNAESADEPEEARAKVISIKRVGNWLWRRFVGIVDAATPALGAWLVALVQNVARW